MCEGAAIAGPGERAGKRHVDSFAEIGVADDRQAALDSADQVEGIGNGSGVVVGHDSKAEVEAASVEDVDWCAVGERITVNVDGCGVLDNHILTGDEDDTGREAGDCADAVEVKRDVAVLAGRPGRVGTDDDVTAGAVEAGAGIDIVVERAVGVGVDVKAETRCRITDGDFDGIGQAAEDDDIVDGADVDETTVGSTDRREVGAGAVTVGTVDGDVGVARLPAGTDRGQAHVLAGSHIILDQHGAGVRGQVDVAAGLNLEAVIRIQGNRISLDNDIRCVVGVGRLGLDPGGV